MNRDQLWQLLKDEGITTSKLLSTPPDAELKIVIAHAPCSAKKLIDTILVAASGKMKNERRPDSPLTSQDELSNLR